MINNFILRIICSVNVSTVVMALGGMDPEGAELGLSVVFVNGNNDTGYWQVQKLLYTAEFY